jgi:hypothetical protein
MTTAPSTRPRLASLEVLQWVGLFGAGVAWAAAHVLAFSLNVATCGTGTSGWGIAYHPTVAVLYGIAFLLAAGAEAAAVAVLLGTRGSSYDDEGPQGRRYFFAVGAALGNVLFLDVIVLSAIGALTHTPCLTS